MSNTPREIGTLIVVVLKANHLPNKRHIGKQDPYCVVAVNGEKRRTKAIKRGGQHPEWDEEIRFTLYEDDSIPRNQSRGEGTPPPPPPKDKKGPKNIKGGTVMKLACYADDPREPDLIGEADVDLTEVLSKGETDEWFTLMNKDKFTGKVYLELTFWSNELPPEKKATAKPLKGNKQYAGPGSFVPAGELPNSLTVGNAHSTGSSPSGSIYNHPRQNSDTVPSSLRASNSLAKLDLYVPPYEQRSRISPMDRVTNEFGEFGIHDAQHRRESFTNGFSQRPSSTLSASPHQTYVYDSNGQEMVPGYMHDRPLTPPGHPSVNHGTIQGSHPYPAYPSYSPQQDIMASQVYHQAPSRGPRHSVPAASSGFMMPRPSPSGFAPLPAHHSDANNFIPPISTGYSSSQFHPTYPPPPSQTPLPTNVQSFIPAGSVPFPPQQTYAPGYAQYAPPPSTSAPPQQYMTPPIAPPHAHSAPPQVYQGYTNGLSLSEDLSPQIPANQPLISTLNSRPLPQEPQIVYAQSQVHTLPTAGEGRQDPNAYNLPPQPGQVSYASNAGYAVPPPPPPPPPPLHYAPAQQSYPPNGTNVNPVPPPPPPPSVLSSRRHVSLPQPPQTSNEVRNHPLPPPPPPPPLLSNQNNSFHHEQVAQPLAQYNEAQWQPTQPTQGGYTTQNYA